jgi:hypothetical protein
LLFQKSRHIDFHPDDLRFPNYFKQIIPCWKITSSLQVSTHVTISIQKFLLFFTLNRYSDMTLSIKTNRFQRRKIKIKIRNHRFVYYSINSKLMHKTNRITHIFVPLNLHLSVYIFFFIWTNKNKCWYFWKNPSIIKVL